MAGAKLINSADRICDLTNIRKEPTDLELRQLMHLVGEDGRRSLLAARMIVRQRRRQSIASGLERRKSMLRELALQKIND